MIRLVALQVLLVSFLPAFNLRAEVSVEIDFVEEVLLEQIAEYMVGSKWTKRALNQADIQKNPQLSSFLSVSRLRGGTAIYLGIHQGEHVFATNFHVCRKMDDCIEETVEITKLGMELSVKDYLGGWSEIDLSLVTVEISQQQAAALSPYKMKFDFDYRYEVGKQLATAGYGYAANPDSELVFTMDSDCVVFDSHVQLLGDPDPSNEAEYKAWSFAHGCDGSHGDSGSALVDRETGNVVGIFWTGRVPKSSFAQNSAKLSVLRKNGDRSIIWSELNYAVPASSIQRYLLNQIEEGIEHSKTLLSIVR